MNTKHTLGPWALELRQAWPFGVVVTAPDGSVIVSEGAAAHSTAQDTRADCEMGFGFPSAPSKFCTNEQARSAIATQDANARLIASAPEMLQMLRHCHEWLQGTKPHRAAAVGGLIAKAAGESA